MSTSYYISNDVLYSSISDYTVIYSGYSQSSLAPILTNFFIMSYLILDRTRDVSSKTDLGMPLNIISLYIVSDREWYWETIIEILNYFISVKRIIYSICKGISTSSHSISKKFLACRITFNNNNNLHGCIDLKSAWFDFCNTNNRGQKLFFS